MSLRKIAIIIIFGAALAIFIEGGAYLTAASLQKKGVFYAPHVRETYQTFQARFNPLLGWPSERNYGIGDYDRSGSRVVPAFPDPDTQPACVSLYGDSFTWGEEVDNEHAWGNVLSKLLACRVANYGVADMAPTRHICGFTIMSVTTPKLPFWSTCRKISPGM